MNIIAGTGELHVGVPDAYSLVHQNHRTSGTSGILHVMLGDMAETRKTFRICLIGRHIHRIQHHFVLFIQTRSQHVRNVFQIQMGRAIQRNGHADIHDNILYHKHNYNHWIIHSFLQTLKGNGIN